MYLLICVNHPDEASVQEVGQCDTTWTAFRASHIVLFSLGVEGWKRKGALEGVERGWG